MPTFDLSFACGEDSLRVRRFSAVEAISTPFVVTVWAASPSPSLPLGDIVGKPAALRVAGGWKHAALGGARSWTGICATIEQVRAEPKGQSIYRFTIVPSLWLLTQRRDYRIFQYRDVPQIAEKILGEWGIDHTWQIDRAAY